MMTPKIRTYHWLFRLGFMRNFVAITLWPYILFRGPNSYTAIWRHEFTHFRQQERLLVVGFYVAYVAEFLWNLLKYRSWMKAYYNISFEIKAREAE